jgi:adenylate cyclase
MPIEIERKFLLADEGWRQQVVRSSRIRQGYMGKADKASVRIRIQGASANINIKSATLGMRRQEYEYAIPLDEAEEMLDTLCNTPQIDKTRFIVEHDGHTWKSTSSMAITRGCWWPRWNWAVRTKPSVDPPGLGAR